MNWKGYVLGLLIAWVVYCGYISYGTRNHIHPLYVFILTFISPVSLPLWEVWQWIKR